MNDDKKQTAEELYASCERALGAIEYDPPTLAGALALIDVLRRAVEQRERERDEARRLLRLASGYVEAVARGDEAWEAMRLLGEIRGQLPAEEGSD